MTDIYPEKSGRIFNFLKEKLENFKLKIV